MDLELKGKVALITGASGGIGAATARVLAKEGVDVDELKDFQSISKPKCSNLILTSSP